MYEHGLLPGQYGKALSKKSHITIDFSKLLEILPCPGWIWTGFVMGEGKTHCPLLLEHSI